MRLFKALIVTLTLMKYSRFSKELAIDSFMAIYNENSILFYKRTKAFK